MFEAPVLRNPSFRLIAGEIDDLKTQTANFAKLGGSLKRKREGPSNLGENRPDRTQGGIKKGAESEVGIDSVREVKEEIQGYEGTAKELKEIDLLENNEESIKHESD